MASIFDVLPRSLMYHLLEAHAWPATTLLNMRRVTKDMRALVGDLELEVDISAWFPPFDFEDEDFWWYMCDTRHKRKKKGLGGRRVLQRSCMLFRLFPRLKGLHVVHRFVGRDSLHKLVVGMILGKGALGQISIDELSFEDVPLAFQERALAHFRVDTEHKHEVERVCLIRCYFDQSEGCACCYKGFNRFAQEMWRRWNQASCHPLTVDLTSSRASGLNLLKEALDWYCSDVAIPKRPLTIRTSRGSIDSTRIIATVVHVDERDASVIL